MWKLHHRCPMHTFFESLIRGFGGLHSPSGKSQTRGHSAPSRITILSLSCPIVCKDDRLSCSNHAEKGALAVSSSTSSTSEQCFSMLFITVSLATGFRYIRPSLCHNLGRNMEGYCCAEAKACSTGSAWLLETCENLRLESKC